MNTHQRPSILRSRSANSATLTVISDSPTIITAAPEFSVEFKKRIRNKKAQSAYLDDYC